ncbi:hypothetical protein [Nocardiopsis lambiniae]|uniref:Uncharacterized protein n=1 Tax=Nocardiopsis lambiniae TaxID=3075539 RepID=A0ABU2M2Y4_9ACTN|nr:hypothetical protein [Nocardiopsis sp. DSM 44743]MDT0326999.1 hypothetical protein [Nocardiopsis sp. DSM 44743]
MSTTRGERPATPVSTQETLIYLQVRRFFCDQNTCQQKIFAEQIPGLTRRYASQTSHLTELLTQLAMALGGRADARFTGDLAAAVIRMSLLRLAQGKAAMGW